MDQSATIVTCERCGSSDLHPATVRSAFWHEDRLIVVDDIPALICSGCQEQFYDDGTAVRLDLLRGAGFPASRAHGELRALVFSLRDQQTETGT